LIVLLLTIEFTGEDFDSYIYEPDRIAFVINGSKYGMNGNIWDELCSSHSSGNDGSDYHPKMMAQIINRE